MARNVAEPASRNRSKYRSGWCQVIFSFREHRCGCPLALPHGPRVVVMVMRSVGTVLIIGGSVVGRVRGGSVVGRVVVLGVQFLLHGFSTLTELSAFAAEVSAS